MPDSPTAESEVVDLARDLLRIDTTNTGDPETLKGERKAAEYVAAKLEDVGFEVTYVESGTHAGRGNVVARLAGADRSRPALLIHGHLDVVPADAGEWSVPPFAGEVKDGYLWGRGAIDMKDMVAMSLAVARQFKRDGTVPPRDLIFAFVADEEAGGFHGVQWLVEHRPELFEGATEAISEVGGFSITLNDTRAYLIQTAEKGLMWLRLRAEGKPGHGSMLQEDNAVAKLAAAVTRLENHRWPLTITPPVREFLDGVSEITGWEFPEDDIDAAVARLGNLSRVIGATLRDTTNLTMFNAGYKANVVPSTATAAVDGRMLPGREEAFEQELLEILGPDIKAEWDKLPPVQTSFDGALVDRMADAITAEDPGARCLPYMVSAGTDAKGFDRLGIRSFGFAPLKLPPDLEFANLFHGIDERVPVDALTFGVRVLTRLLQDC